MGKGSAMKSYCTIQLPHARPTMHCIPLVGASAASPTLVDKTKICLYIYIFIYLYIYMVRTYSVYTSCPICARCNISTLHVGSCNHCCSREKTSSTERLNSGKQRNRNLKTVKKGRHYYLDGG